MIKIVIDERNPMHTRFRVFAGRHEGALGLCGKLVMRNEEFDEFIDSFKNVSKKGTKFIVKNL